MSKLKILVVDDANFIRDLVKRTVKQTFPTFDLDEAINGKKGQSLIKKTKYHLILCDWEMPEMSGIELLQWLREYEEAEGLSKTPFVMVTSRGDKQNVVEAVQTGVTDYIGKPFTSDQLVKKVIKALSKDHKALMQDLFKKGGAKVAEPANPFGGNSASALMGGQSASAKPKPKVTGGGSLLADNAASNQLLTNQPVAKSKSKRAIKAELNIRTARHETVAAIRDVNLQKLVVTFDRDKMLPMLFEQVVVDVCLKSDSSQLARINTYVESLKALERGIDCEQIQMTLVYVDDDPVKLELLTRFISEVR